MKRKIYTRSHSSEVLQAMKSDVPFSAEEHAIASQEEFGIGHSRESLIVSYLRKHHMKVEAIERLAQWMQRDGLRSVVSLGSGPGVLEWMLKQSLPSDCFVAASDFDPHVVKLARELLPEITAVQFDFYKDSVADLRKRLPESVDTAVFFGSSFVLDDEDFVRVFRQLRTELEVRKVIDFQSGFLGLRGCAGTVVHRLRERLDKHYAPGKFHGYARSQRSLVRLYREAGFSRSEAVKVPGYPFTAVLDA